MRLISIINQKGGSSKTTTAVNLAASLSFYHKKKVLLIDLDPQGSSSLWFDKLSIEKGIFKIFIDNNEDIEKIILNTEFENIKIIPSSNWLIGLEKALANEIHSETILKKSINKLINKNYFEYIIIDCPPNLGIITINALSCCNEVIIPVESRIMALAGLVQLLNTIDIVKRRINKELKIAGILPCRVDLRTKHSKEVVEELRSKFKDLVYKNIIRENIKLSQAPSFKKPIVYYDKTSNGAIDYYKFSLEVINQENIYINNESISNINNQKII